MLMNPSVYRRLAMAGTDANNSIYSTPNIRVLQAIDELRSDSAAPVLGLESRDFIVPEELEEIEEQKNLPDRHAKEAAKEAAQKPATAGGVTEMDWVAMMDMTGGLQWTLYLSRGSDRFPFPFDCSGQVRTVA